MLSVYGAFFPITTLYSNMTVSQGRSGINLWTTVVLCVLIWAGLIVLHPYGLRVMVVFFVTLNILWLGVWQWFARRLIGLTLWNVLSDVLPFLLFASLVMLTAGWVASHLSNVWLRLLCKIVLAVTLYAGILWVSGARIMRESIDYIFHRSR